MMLTGSSAKGDAVSPLAGRLIVVVGAGGAGKAVAYGAKEKGARVVVANRTYGNSLSYLSIMSNMAILIEFFFTNYTQVFIPSFIAHTCKSQLTSIFFDILPYNAKNVKLITEFILH